MSFTIGTIFFVLGLYSFTRHINNEYNRMFGRRLGRAGGGLQPPDSQRTELKTELKTSSSIWGGSADADNRDGEEFYPSLEDVSQVRNILRQIRSPSSTSKWNGSVPDEVIDIILDEAEYWPSVVTTLQTIPLMIRQDCDRQCVRTPPLCYSLEEEDDKKEETDSSATATNKPQILLHRGIHPCRKIIFDITSHDQGWGGGGENRGTFKGSYTWFDVYMIPSKHRRGVNGSNIDLLATNVTGSAVDDDSGDGSGRRSVSSHPRPFLPKSTKLQCNLTAIKDSTDYHIVWHYRDHIKPDSPEAEEIEQETGRGGATLDGSAVRNMEIGDEVSVWARARFAGWRSHTDKMSVRVFWAA